MMPVLNDVDIFEISNYGRKKYMLETTKGIFHITEALYRALQNLDGHTPLVIDGLTQKETNSVLKTLVTVGIVRTSRWRKEHPYRYLTLFLVGNKANEYVRPICKTLYGAFHKCILPIALGFWGVGYFLPYENACDGGVIAYFLLLLFSTLFHELGHSIPALGINKAKCSVDEIGVVFWNLVPVGLYISCSLYRESIRPKDQMRIVVGGFEADILLSSILYLLSRLFSSETFLFGAALNLIMGMTNMLPYGKNDGDLLLKLWREKRREKYERKI